MNSLKKLLASELPHDRLVDCLDRFPEIETIVLNSLSENDCSVVNDIVSVIHRERLYRNRTSLRLGLRLLDCMKPFCGHGKLLARLYHNQGEILWYQAFMSPEKTADLIEKSLSSYRLALKEISRNDHPRIWASVMESLALVTIDRVYGDRCANMKVAIEIFESILDGFDLSDYPIIWGNTMINLGSIYGQLSGEDSAETMEKSIQCITGALKVFTRESNPETWAILQTNLGTAYRHRVQGKPADNIDRAISLYENAIKVFNKEFHPERWAMLNCNLGNAYSQRLYGNDEDNVSRSITAYERGLSIQNENMPPFHRAMLQYNFARVLIKRGRHQGDSEDLDQAIGLCRDGLSVCSGAYPLEEAMLHAALGEAWRYCPVDDEMTRQEHMNAACGHLSEALKTHTVNVLPASNLLHNLSLAEIYLETNELERAESSLQEAMLSCEAIYSQAFTQVGQQRVIERMAPVYFLAALCAARMGDPERALLRLEMGKARSLNRRLELDGLAVSCLDPSEQKRLVRTGDEIQKIEYQLQKPGVTSSDFIALSRVLKEKRKWQIKQIEKHRSANGLFDDNPDVKAVLGAVFNRSETAIVEFCITDMGTVVIVGHNVSESVEGVVLDTIVFPEFTEKIVESIGKEWINSSNVFKSTGRRAADIAAWEARATRLLLKLGTELFRSIDRYLGLLNIRNLIVIPHRFLHLIPLHLIPVENSGKTMYLMEKYCVSYAPGLTALHHLSSVQRTECEEDTVVIVSNPTGDLVHAEDEAVIVSQFFRNAKILQGNDVTKQTIQTHTVNAGTMHFACHGIFDVNSPWGTGLILATESESNHRDQGDFVSSRERTQRSIFFSTGENEGQTSGSALMSIIDICHNLDLSQTELVVLSACESGMVMTTGAADEVIGLSTGFLQAGAKSVVNSLWLVDDVRSKDLVSAFYQNLKQTDLTVDHALKRAQLQLKAQGYSFYYWGGFTVTGCVS